MGFCYRWSSPGIHTRPLFFLLYVNGIPNVISNISNPVLYADDTNLIIINSNSQMFQKSINTAILQLNRWFSRSQVLLNLEKTNFFAVFY
jgi:hypothetical protein